MATLKEKLADAWACEACRIYRRGVVIVLALLVLTWWLT